MWARSSHTSSGLAGGTLSQELSFWDRLKRALLSATAQTSEDATDARLEGRTYAIPFSRVWNAALDLVRGELPRWHARWWDEETGIIQALTRGRVSRRASDVVIRIRLDAEAQTRVDLSSTSRTGRVGDLGGNTRLIGAFTYALDRKLAPPPAPPAPRSENNESIPESTESAPEDARATVEDPADDHPAGDHARERARDDAPAAPAPETAPPASPGDD